MITDTLISRCIKYQCGNSVTVCVRRREGGDFAASLRYLELYGKFKLIFFLSSHSVTVLVPSHQVNVRLKAVYFLGVLALV